MIFIQLVGLLYSYYKLNNIDGRKKCQSENKPPKFNGLKTYVQCDI